MYALAHCCLVLPYFRHWYKLYQDQARPTTLNAIHGLFCLKMKMRDFYVLFLRKAHNTEHPSRGCPHLVLISQLSRLKQCG